MQGGGSDPPAGDIDFGSIACMIALTDIQPTVRA
jgi:hypothetical protein